MEVKKGGERRGMRKKTEEGERNALYLRKKDGGDEEDKEE